MGSSSQHVHIHSTVIPINMLLLFVIIGYVILPRERYQNTATRTKIIRLLINTKKAGLNNNKFISRIKIHKYKFIYQSKFV
jgi:hypothetical protein